jgi:hypothetical protein
MFSSKQQPFQSILFAFSRCPLLNSTGVRTSIISAVGCSFIFFANSVADRFVLLFCVCPLLQLVNKIIKKAKKTKIYFSLYFEY